MRNMIKIQNEKHDVEMSMGSQCGTGYELVNLKDVEKGFFVFPIIKGETELGTYTVQLIHGVNNSGLKVLRTDFKPHKQS